MEVKLFGAKTGKVLKVLLVENTGCLDIISKDGVKLASLVYEEMTRDTDHAEQETLDPEDGFFLTFKPYGSAAHSGLKEAAQYIKGVN